MQRLTRNPKDRSHRRNTLPSPNHSQRLKLELMRVTRPSASFHNFLLTELKPRKGYVFQGQGQLRDFD
jgi:hypothetical protein